MLKSRFLLITALLFLSFFTWGIIGYGQENYSLSGNVTNESGELLEFGNVLILSSTDSSIIKGDQCWDGKFELHGIETTDFILKVSAVGFEDYYQSGNFVVNDTGWIQLDTIKMKIDVLGVVDVLYIVPVFEREIDRLVINVDETIMSDRGTAYDVLKSAPNVIVKSNGEIHVVGKGPAIIYLDGQRLMSMELLKAISSKEIKKINIIENPSAKYDAEGRAVIEIITKSSDYEGIQGSVYLMGFKATNFYLRDGLSINYRKNKWSTTFSYAHVIGKDHLEDRYFRRIEDTQVIRLENTRMNDSKLKINAFGSLKLKYELDSISSVYVTNQSFINNRENESIGTNTIFEDDVQIGTLNSETLGQLKSFNNNLTAGYERKLDTLGSELSISGNYIFHDAVNASDIVQVTDLGVPTYGYFNNQNSNGIRVYSGKVDYRKSFSPKLNFDFGVKESYIRNNSSVKLEELVDDAWLIDSNAFNGFDYTENIAAAYSQMTGRIDKFSYILGLRYENTQTNGISTVYNENVINRNYQNFFPNLQLGFDITPDLIFSASYSYRITRPTYQDLNPFIDYIDSLSYFRGNPLLLPSYTHSADVALVYFEYASIKLGYQYSLSPFFPIVEKEPSTNTFSVVTKNIESSEAYSISIVLPYEFPWWTTFNSFGYTFNTFNYLEGTTVITNDKPSFYISLYNEFRLKKLFAIELTYDYVSPGAQGVFTMQPYQSYGFSIARSFLNDKLKIRFSGFDIFFMEIETGSSTLENVQIDYTSRNDTRLYVLSATWNFGKIKVRGADNEWFEGDESDRIKK